ncbi:hypothetical protein UPYG_G00309710 [Umbra pygmaea]|uniref:Ig-like domain-containing protein n=1 Tax=Umbra pygmaea TaxID=75934 RepID=A0ABD0WGC4_UMBPY
MVTWAANYVVILNLLSALLITPCACRQLPPLPLKDGCFQVSPELMMFHVQGEAVVLSCRKFERVLYKRFAQAKVEYVITKGNKTEAVGAGEREDGRIIQCERQLWLLPAQPSDSGQYSCIYRNEKLCVVGSITVEVYETMQTGMENLSYNFNTNVGRNVSILCPHIKDFNWTDEIEWYKDSSQTVLPVGSGFYHKQSKDRMLISDVRHTDQGRYTCQLRVYINNIQYNVSRIIKLTVKGPHPFPYTQVTKVTTDITVTPDPSLSTVEFQGPQILAPLNGTIFERPLGSALEISCQVFTESQSANTTVVTWLVNGQSVESSYLGGRALMSKRRTTTVDGGYCVEVKLYITEMFQEDARVELKCVTQNKRGRQEVIARFKVKDSMSTWLMVWAAACVCFLTVVSVFGYLLRKPRRKADYILARQNSTFSSTFSSES